MKKILGIVLTSALLWSCGSQFSRSKYDRYMWNRSGNAVEKEVTATETKKEVAPKNENKAEELALTENADHLSLAERKVASVETQKEEIKSVSSQESTVSFEKKEDEKTGFSKSKKKHEINRIQKSDNNPMQGGDVDAMWIVTLIMCFLLPPLGVYLKDGSITGLFWLVLILCLVGGGPLFGLAGYYGGFYGVAIILALLRFFDII